MQKYTNKYSFKVFLKGSLFLKITHIHILELHPGLLESAWVTASSIPANGERTLLLEEEEAFQR
jgi:hypothetical protein